MQKDCYLFREEQIPQKAAFPVIDAHNHLWGDWNVEKIIETLDEVGVAGYCDLTANIKLSFVKGGYVFKEGNILDFFNNCASKYAGRFYCFTMSDFAKPVDVPLFQDVKKFVKSSVKKLEEHVKLGARGLKILKELGLIYRNANNELINIDDPQFSPIWEKAGDLGIPVLIHQSDPYGFFQPVNPNNEHFETLKKYPSWSFADKKFPRKEKLIKRRDNLIKQYPKTTFILPHITNFAENLKYVSELLDKNPNVYIDFSARLDELGRQPYTARDFFIKYQDRILFGTDMPANIPDSVDMYRCYFRFLETYDESFFAPDYDGTFSRYRWPICGIGLPGEVLRKVYYQNALRIIPGLVPIIKDLIK